MAYIYDNETYKPLRARHLDPSKSSEESTKNFKIIKLFEKAKTEDINNICSQTKSALSTSNSR